MKRKIALLLALALMLLAGCQQQAPAEAAPAKSPREQGAELVPLMGEMAGNPLFAEIYGWNTEMSQALTSAREGDFSSPKAVYCIRVPDSALNNLMGSAGFANLDEFSEGLRKNIRARAASSLPTQLNAMGGSQVLAAASMCTASKTFVDASVTDNMIYVYVYEDAVPAAVVFTPGEGGAVSATGMLILYDGFQAGSLEELSELLGQLGAEVSEVSE